MEKVFNYLSRIIDLIFCKNKLFQYELVCLSAWKSSLTSNSLMKLEKQLETFDCVERHVFSLKTVFHCIADYKYQQWSDHDLFPSVTGEGKAFTGRLSGVEGDIHITMNFSIYIHNGRFFSIEFSSSPEALSSFLLGNMSVDKCKTIIKL